MNSEEENSEDFSSVFHLRIRPLFDILYTVDMKHFYVILYFQDCAAATKTKPLQTE